jgi:hypothetical protein
MPQYSEALPRLPAVRRSTLLPDFADVCRLFDQEVVKLIFFHLRAVDLIAAGLACKQVHPLKYSAE